MTVADFSVKSMAEMETIIWLDYEMRLGHFRRGFKPQKQGIFGDKADS